MEAEIRNYFAQRARGPAPMFGMQQRAQQVRPTYYDVCIDVTDNPSCA